MKNLHYGHCLLGIGLAVVLLVALGVSTSTLGFLAIVAICPLMMFVMMRSMMSGSEKPASHDEEVDRHQHV